MGRQANLSQQLAVQVCLEPSLVCRGTAWMWPAGAVSVWSQSAHSIALSAVTGPSRHRRRESDCAGPPRILNASAKRTSSRSARAAVTARCGRSCRSGWSLTTGRSTGAPPCSGTAGTGERTALRKRWAALGPGVVVTDSPWSGVDNSRSPPRHASALASCPNVDDGLVHSEDIAAALRISVAGPECALGADVSVACASAAAQTGWHQAPRNVGTTCHAMKVC